VDAVDFPATAIGVSRSLQLPVNILNEAMLLALQVKLDLRASTMPLLCNMLSACDGIIYLVELMILAR